MEELFLIAVVKKWDDWQIGMFIKSRINRRVTKRLEARFSTLIVTVKERTFITFVLYICMLNAIFM
jgi:hypothetical protein